ncbi:uncharacterized protein LAESUDRAFT_747333 [Laetiporus sulphureus 93-53]|uniref:Uncharacterized protein n=1 Tax=Laetiporus sulphureus 93-53 TaxID=1314785 RepID=A0A165GQ03_9APHY|nr:uncharacterized protein LAESUDRAFT_747333 [Laetiporus sulphureus 93-53]KZT10649.1 hypothetical protein LAESUDRAFT_747333 [Laetiporus sulphureus 93-53]
MADLAFTITGCRGILLGLDLTPVDLDDSTSIDLFQNTNSFTIVTKPTSLLSMRTSSGIPSRHLRQADPSNSWENASFLKIPNLFLEAEYLCQGTIDQASSQHHFQAVRSEGVNAYPYSLCRVVRLPHVEHLGRRSVHDDTAGKIEVPLLLESPQLSGWWHQTVGVDEWLKKGL